jgi:hypothetical protein
MKNFYDNLDCFTIIFIILFFALILRLMYTGEFILFEYFEYL